MIYTKGKKNHQNAANDYADWVFFNYIYLFVHKVFWLSVFLFSCQSQNQNIT